MIGTANCTYETPCGWCTKWDKKCDRKIGCGKDKDLKRIKSGCGLVSTDTHTTASAGIKTDVKKLFPVPRTDKSYICF